jgi:hypothetical protein
MKQADEQTVIYNLRIMRSLNALGRMITVPVLN